MIIYLFKLIKNFKMEKIKKFLNEPFFVEKKEWTNSPYIIFFIIFYIIVGIIYISLITFRWIVLGLIRPFINSKWLCKQGFHKYRETHYDANYIYYKCLICNKKHKSSCD
jgi:hypothetical protein